MSPLKYAPALSLPSFGVAVAAPSPAHATAALLAATALALLFGVVLGSRARTSIEAPRAGAVGGIAGDHLRPRAASRG